MKVSVAMATYNGESHLAQQLASLAYQSRVPDEIVICDDGSTDATLNVARAFANERSDISIKVFRNDIRLGYAENFMEAMRRCSGDIIFICDQDDVWFESKIASICDYFACHPGSWLVINDAELTNSNLNRAGLTVGGQVEGVGKRSSEHFFGCCMGLRSTLFALADPLPAHHSGHDGWISELANYLDVRSYLDLPLQYYRRHGSNASACVTSQLKASSKWSWLVKQIANRNVITPVQASEKRIKMLTAVEGRLVRDERRLMVELPDATTLDHALLDLRQKITLNTVRRDIQSRGGVSRLFSATVFALRGKYRRFEGWKSWVRDVSG